MESNPDSTALAQQVQARAATVKELTMQNQEMKLRLQQEENRSKGNPEDEGDSQRRSDHQRPISPDEKNSDLLREMKEEMDKLRSAIKEKTCRSVDRLVRATNSPFTAGSPGMSRAVEVPAALARAFWRNQGPPRPPQHLQDDTRPSIAPWRNIVSLLSYHPQRSCKGVVHKVANIVNW